MPTVQNLSRARIVRRRTLAVTRERFMLSIGLETGFLLLALCLSTYGASRWLSSVQPRLERFSMTLVHIRMV